MEKPKPMLTLSQVMNKLAQKGVVKEYRMNDEGEMRLTNSDKNYEPSELTILRSYRFEGDSNPDDNAVLYVAVDHEDNRGMIIDSYGAESNYPGDKFDEFLRNISINESDEYNFQE
ncbi:hypothetical protein [Halpernia frigidisoli]|uniref:Phosphoribosylpyrophosphate synthetase n=1 Tax=Halpernia frigidisoli TaxID=1125876 RepID=A0A1I3HR98_9FLAO|nr:hypothetical protein [Halpernia frigidisoli]SFI38255.1 hypothetical protein SAMN05443292_2353 [Halpernia frigidisoli]